MADEVDVHTELKQLKERMTNVEGKVDENTAVTQKIKTDTTEIIELFSSFKGAFSVLEKLGKLARPIGYIAAAAAGVAGAWAALKGGGK